MADNKMNQNPNQSPNQTMKHEQAKGEVSGGNDRQREQGSKDSSAIGGQQWQQGEKGQSGSGETGQKKEFDRNSDDSASKTGEPGRARNELGSDNNR